MLPTQGQGASQAIEDAEALGAIFSDIKEKPTRSQITERLKVTSLSAIHLEAQWLTSQQIVFNCRYERATLIQGYSRESGKPATDKGNNKITMSVVRIKHVILSLIILGIRPSSWTTIVPIMALKTGLSDRPERRSWLKWKSRRVPRQSPLRRSRWLQLLWAVNEGC